MIRYDFAVVAQEQTEYWNLPEESTLKTCRIFCLSLFRIGEATHVCSLTPSTYVDDLENLFVNRDGSPLTDAQQDELDRHEYYYTGLDHSYIGYINPDTIGSNTKVGDIYWNEYDPADFADWDSERERSELMDREAWQDAREEISANSAAYEPSLSGYIPDYID